MADGTTDRGTEHGGALERNACPPAPGIDASTAEVERIFKLQQQHQYTIAKTTARERKEKLKRLETVFLARRDDIRAALYDDFRKHPSEVDLTEVFPVTSRRS